MTIEILLPQYYREEIVNCAYRNFFQDRIQFSFYYHDRITDTIRTPSQYKPIKMEYGKCNTLYESVIVHPTSSTLPTIYNKYFV